MHAHPDTVRHHDCKAPGQERRDESFFEIEHQVEPGVQGGSRTVTAVICTHGHNDHITVAPDLSHAFDAPVLMHPGDEMLWRMTHPNSDFQTVTDDMRIAVGGTELIALHTPGHSPGSVCWHAPEINAVFSGDTLFNGGTGATGRSFSDFPTILQSIRDRLSTLPFDTVVYTGHGNSTTVGDEIVYYDDWVARGS